MGSVNKYYSLYFIIFFIFLILIIVTIPSVFDFFYGVKQNNSVNLTDQNNSTDQNNQNNRLKSDNRKDRSNLAGNAALNRRSSFDTYNSNNLSSIPSTVSIPDRYIKRIPNTPELCQLDQFDKFNRKKLKNDVKLIPSDFFHVNKMSPQYISPSSSMNRVDSNVNIKPGSISNGTPKNGILQRRVSFDRNDQTDQTGQTGQTNQTNRNEPKFSILSRSLTASTAISELTFGSDYPFIEKKYPVAGYHFSEQGRKFGSNSEKITCKVFEQFLGRRVQINIRPNFLKNPKTGRNLELDMFDPITKIAIEYNGEQHYHFVPKFNSNKQDVESQKERDILKRKLCEENGIILITVPYTIDSAISNGKGGFRYISRTNDEKEKKIASFLVPLLEESLGF